MVDFTTLEGARAAFKILNNQVQSIFSWTFSGNRLKNVGNAVELDDAVTLQQLNDAVSTTSSSALGTTKTGTIIEVAKTIFKALVTLSSVIIQGLTTNALLKTTASGQVVSSAVIDDGADVRLIGRGLVVGADKLYLVDSSAFVAATLFFSGANPDVLRILNFQRSVGGSISLEVANGTVALLLTATLATFLDKVNTPTGYQIAGANGLTNSVTLAKLTTGGANGSITFSGGIITAFVAPT